METHGSQVEEEAIVEDMEGDSIREAIDETMTRSKIKKNKGKGGSCTPDGTQEKMRRRLGGIEVAAALEKERLKIYDNKAIVKRLR